MDIDGDSVASGAGGASPPAVTSTMGRGRRLKKPAAIVSDDEIGPSDHSNSKAISDVAAARKVPQKNTADDSSAGGNSDDSGSASDEDAGFTRKRKGRGGKVLRRAKADKATASPASAVGAAAGKAAARGRGRAAAASVADAASDATSGSDGGSDDDEGDAPPPAKRSRGRSAGAAATAASKARQTAQPGRGRGRGRGGAAKRSAGGRGADAGSDDDDSAAGAGSGGEGRDGGEEDVLATQAFVASSLDPRLKELVDAGSGKRATYHVYAQAATQQQAQTIPTAGAAAAAAGGAGGSGAAGCEGAGEGAASGAGQAPQAAALVFNAYLVSGGYCFAAAAERAGLLERAGSVSLCKAQGFGVVTASLLRAGRRGTFRKRGLQQQHGGGASGRLKNGNQTRAGLMSTRLCFMRIPASLPPPCSAATTGSRLSTTSSTTCRRVARLC